MINTTLLEKNIEACDFYDLCWYNGPDKPGTPAYTKQEQQELINRKKELLKQLAQIEAANNE